MQLPYLLQGSYIGFLSQYPDRTSRFPTVSCNASLAGASGTLMHCRWMPFPLADELLVVVFLALVRRWCWWRWLYLSLVYLCCRGVLAALLRAQPRGERCSRRFFF